MAAKKSTWAFKRRAHTKNLHDASECSYEIGHPEEQEAGF
ncbi:unnamed protein product [marine sediment metagenome]|uniref:Uncharacterized protein n=1 Tax=marine sediment metagenome TaxID=412755 RepID=X0VFV6_9ZZZZ